MIFDWIAMHADNDNFNPLFRYADTALAELCRVRRELLAVDGSNRPLSWWRERRGALDAIARAERLCLPYL
jgi:hypothetical protein